jgi:hypothetical protein
MSHPFKPARRFVFDPVGVLLKRDVWAVAMDLKMVGTKAPVDDAVAHLVSFMAALMAASRSPMLSGQTS